MFGIHIKLLCLLLILSVPVANAGSTRLHTNNKVRGNSFGLENYLLQTLEDAEPKDAIRSVKKRPTEATKRTDADGGKIYENENVNAAEYLINHPESISILNSEQHNHKHPHKGSEGFSKEKTVRAPHTTDVVSSQYPAHDSGTERSRTRVVMRRRKRPMNSSPGEGGADFTENGITKTSGTSGFYNAPRQQVKAPLYSKSHGQKLFHSGTKLNITTTNQPDNVNERMPEIEITKITTTPTGRKGYTTPKPTTLNLKSLLKQQTETLSLSELLQTQNLSLADLLKGNRDALAILKEKQSVSSTPPPYKSKVYGRVESGTKHFDSSLRGQEASMKIATVEVTTQRQTFNNVHSKILGTPFYKQLNTKLDSSFPSDSENAEEKVKTTKRTGLYGLNTLSYDAQTRFNELRTKLRNQMRRTQIPSKEPETAQKGKTETVFTSRNGVTTTTETPLYKKKRIPFKSSNNPELTIFMSEKKPETTEKISTKVSSRTNRIPLKKVEQEKVKPNDYMTSRPLKVPILEETNEKLEVSTFEIFATTTTTTTEQHENVIPDDFRKYEAKDDLIDLLKSGHNADKLQKILEARNMTLREILYNREKPTVHSNIEELFSNHPKRDEHVTRPTLIFDSLPEFKTPETLLGKPYDAIQYDEPYAEESAPVMDRIKPSRLNPSKQSNLPFAFGHEESSLNLQPDDLMADISNTENLAVWKLSEKSNSYGSSFGHGDSFPTNRNSEKSIIYTTNDIILLETLERNQVDHKKLENLIRRGETGKAYIPPAVKSAIIASGVVMGIALCVFIAIFATCGWRQRQVRLKGSPTILGEVATKSNDKSRKGNTITSASHKDVNYKKTVDFDDETSDSGTSFAGSYLWSTFKNTFTSRANTLINRLEKEEKLREDKTILKKNEYGGRERKGRSEDKMDACENQRDRTAGKTDRRDVTINKNSNIKRSLNNINVEYYGGCAHRY